jgi:hypothetical protein
MASERYISKLGQAWAATNVGGVNPTLSHQPPFGGRYRRTSVAAHAFLKIAAHGGLVEQFSLCGCQLLALLVDLDALA